MDSLPSRPGGPVRFAVGRGILFLLVAVSAVACASSLPRLSVRGDIEGRPTLPPPPPGGYDYARPYPLLPGDRINIRVLDEPTLNAVMEIPADGVLEVFKSESGPGQERQTVQAKGRTTTELAEAIAGVYSRTKFTTKPLVQVTLEYAVPREVYLMGEVRSDIKTVSLPASRRMTLTQAINASGGFTDRADETRVRVSRKDPATGTEVSLPVYNVRELIDRAAYDRDPPLEPNDIITVPRLRDVSVFGNIQSPGTYVARPGMTLIDLVAAAGGFKPFSKLSDVRVIRGEGLTSERTYSVNVNEILDGTAPDPRMEGGDRVFVDEDWK